MSTKRLFCLISYVAGVILVYTVIVHMFLVSLKLRYQIYISKGTANKTEAYLTVVGVLKICLHPVPQQGEWTFMTTEVRKLWRATTCCGKSKFAIPPRWLQKGNVSHPDDTITLSQLIRMRYQPQLSHPVDIRWKSMSSGWYNKFAVTDSDEIRTPAKSSGWYNASTISHPHEILPIAKRYCQ